MPINYFKALDNIIAGNITESGTVTRFPLGAVVRGVNQGTGTGTASQNEGGALFQYCQGSNVSSAGQFVNIIGNSAVLLAAGNSESRFPIGVAAAPMTATNVYGFVQIYGMCDYVKTTNQDFAAGRLAYICPGTAGLAVSSTVLGNQIQGLANAVAFLSSGGTGTGTDLIYSNLTMQLRFPHVIGSSAAV